MRVRSFPALALTTALLTVGLIVLGAVVRVTDSGLGCGDHWPLCNGTVFPPLDNLTAWIEWTHRLLAILIGVLGIGMLVVAARHYRRQNRGVLVATVIAALMYAVQALLGAAVVKMGLNPTLVTLHLGTAMLLLAGLLVAALLSYKSAEQYYPRDGFSALAYITAGFALLIIFTGAYVRGSGATLACLTWPLCNGEVVPVNQGTLALIHMLHRFAVAALGATLLLLVWQASAHRGGRIRQYALLALVAYLCQAAVGAMVVFSGADALWMAAHVAFAAATWAFLVVLCVIETLNTARQQAGGSENEWRPQSEALLS